MSHLITFILALSFSTVSLAITDEVVLTIFEEGEPLQKYSQKMLDVHPESFSLSTMTPWTNAVDQYKAIPLKSILGSIINKYDTLHLKAENGFEVHENIRFLLDADAFLAFKKNGQFMRLRDKGPVWLLFPYSQRPKLDDAFHNQVAVWMLYEVNAYNK